MLKLEKQLQIERKILIFRFNYFYLFHLLVQRLFLLLLLVLLEQKQFSLECLDLLYSLRLFRQLLPSYQLMLKQLKIHRGKQYIHLFYNSNLVKQLIHKKSWLHLSLDSEAKPTPRVLSRNRMEYKPTRS